MCGFSKEIGFSKGDSGYGFERNAMRWKLIKVDGVIWLMILV